MRSIKSDNHVSFLDGNTGPAKVNAPQVSPNLFAVLGVHPAMGRTFEGQSDGSALAGEANTLILSDPVWRTAYGSDPNILGKIIKLNGKSYAVIGIMSRAFAFPFSPAIPLVWRPVVIGNNDAVRKRNETPDYQVIARLNSDATLRSAESELKAIQPGIAGEYADPYDRELVTSVQLQRYDDSLVGSDLKKALAYSLRSIGRLMAYRVPQMAPA